MAVLLCKLSAVSYQLSALMIKGLLLFAGVRPDHHNASMVL
jgi:hypothetical protein